MSEDVESITYTSDFVVDKAYQRSLVRGLFAVTFRSPLTWIILAVFAFFIVAMSAAPVPQFGTLGLWVILIGGAYGLLYLRLRRTISKTFPVGRRVQAGFGGDHFAIRDGENSSVLAYSGFDRLEARGDLLWLRRITPRRRAAYPLALFPSAELDRMRAAITKAATRG